MNEHLVNLLYEECKLEIVFDEFKKYGFEVQFSLNNFDIVLDIVGFPTDKEILIKDLDFARDWLHDEFFNIRTEKIGNPRVMFTPPDGLYLESQEEGRIKTLLHEYVEWLFSELEELKRDRQELF